MSETQIKAIIQGYLQDAINGMSKENPKLDFKAKWYDLTLDNELNEFIKDTSSIANTPGLDGFIVIGFDDKNKTFLDSTFSQSGLKDSNELTGIIIKRVDRNFVLVCYDVNIDGHKLSVLHIPPSFDKPHVIKNYKKGLREEQHRVFIRHGTTTRLATKYDLDFIAYDRKNLTPEYSLYLSMSRASIEASLNSDSRIEMIIGLVIENNGQRPVAITSIQLTFVYSKLEMFFTSVENRRQLIRKRLRIANLTLQPNEIKRFPDLVFCSLERKTNSEFIDYLKWRDLFVSVTAALHLNNRRELTSTVEIL